VRGKPPYRKLWPAAADSIKDLIMTRRTNTPARSSRWLFAAVTLLGGFACQNAAEPQVQGEPARTASGAREAPAAQPDHAPKADSAPKADGASQPSGAAAPVASPAAPSAQVGLARYEEPSAAAAPSAPADVAPSQRADAPKAAPGQTVQGTVVQDETFSTWLQAASPVVAGSPATVEAVLVAKAPYHCNAEYPHKFKLAAAPAGLSYPEATVKGMQVTAERSVLRIPVVAQSAGKSTVSGTLHFSVCNDDRCLVEKRELSLNLEVK
jgi:hypothetical protein